jgi:hypothetical protein
VACWVVVAVAVDNGIAMLENDHCELPIRRRIDVNHAWRMMIKW